MYVPSPLQAPCLLCGGGMAPVASRMPVPRVLLTRAAQGMSMHGSANMPMARTSACEPACCQCVLFAFARWAASSVVFLFAVGCVSVVLLPCCPRIAVSPYLVARPCFGAAATGI